MNLWRLLFGILFLVVCSCQENAVTQFEERTPVLEIRPEFANGFEIDDYGDYKKVTIKSPFMGAEKGITYYLLPRGSNLKDQFKGQKVIEIPITSIVCTSTTHIPLVDYLDVEDALVGFPTLDYISSLSVRERIDQGKVVDLGAQVNLNLEMLVSIQPDMVMSYSLNGDLSQMSKIEQSGIPVILNSEYLEPHPLGRAEWLKFLAVFFDKLPMADSIFDKIKMDYLNVSKRVEDVTVKPKILSGVVYGDTWFLPGGENYASRIIKDAGGDYIWGNDSSSGYLELSFESVYNRAANADYWIGVASYNSLEQLVEGDARYAEFNPYRKMTVYSYNKQIGDKGGNQYLELGYLRPDIILKDLVSIFHPDRLDSHNLYFYEQLK